MVISGYQDKILMPQTEYKFIIQILIGVNNYNDPKLVKLKYPARACQKIAEVLKKNIDNYLRATGEIFNTISQPYIFHDEVSNPDELPTFENVKPALEKICQEAKESDMILVYFVGHGDKDKFLYLQNTIAANPESRLELDYLVSQLRKSQASKIIIFLDACHSGNLTFTGLDIEQTSEEIFKQIENQTEEKTPNFFAILSSGAQEYSYEFASLKMPLFSYFLKGGLEGEGEAGDNKGDINTWNLAQYIQTRVQSYIESYQQQQNEINLLRLGDSDKSIQESLELKIQQNPKVIANSSQPIILGKKSANFGDLPRKILIMGAPSDEESWTKILSESAGYRVLVWQPGSTPQATLSEFFQGEGIALLYLRASLLDSKFILGETQELTISQLRAILEKGEDLQQIILLDCQGSSQEEIQKYTSAISLDLTKGQCIIATSTPTLTPNHFSNLLKETLTELQSTKGLLITTWVKRLQERLSEEKIYCLLQLQSGLLEVIPKQNYTEDLNYWRVPATRIISNKLSHTPLGFGKKRDFNLYVDLELQERQKKQVIDRQAGEESTSEMYKVSRSSRTILGEKFFKEISGHDCQKKLIAIIGEPGAGKTTISLKMADWLLSRTNYLPIWVSLADLSADESLEDYLCNQWLSQALCLWKEEITAEIKQSLRKQFKEGRVWLLLDGVDELANTSGNPLADIVKQVEKWENLVGVLLTCRLNVWDANQDALYSHDFEVYKTKEFEPEQIKIFINRYFQDNQALGEELFTQLEQPEQKTILNLVKNPLRLTLVCQTWPDRQQLGLGLPTNETELYRNFTEYFYEYNGAKGLITTPKEQRELNCFLGELGKWAIAYSSSRFRLRFSEIPTKVRIQWQRELKLEVDKLFELAIKLGWLNIVGVAVENPSENVYAFYHPTFEEYFTATVIEDWDFFLPREHKNKPVKDVSGNYRSYRVFEKKWEKVILLWIEGKEVDVEGFINKLFSFEDGGNYGESFYRERGIFLAVKCIILWENKEKSLKLLLSLRNNLDYFSFRLQKTMEEAVTDIGFEKGFEFLSFLRNNPDFPGNNADFHWVARGLHQALITTMLSQNRFMPLFYLLYGPENWTDILVKRAVAYVLNFIDSEKGFKSLLPILNNSDIQFRAAVAYVMGHIDSKKGLEFFVYLLNDPDASIRAAVVEALGEIASEKAIEPLLSLLNDLDDEDKSLRLKVLEALGKIDSKKAIEPLLSLLNDLDDEDKSLRCDVVEALGKIGFEKAIEQLLSLLNDSDEKKYLQYLRLKVLEALRKIGSEKAIEALLSLLNDLRLLAKVLLKLRYNRKN